MIKIDVGTYCKIERFFYMFNGKNSSKMYFKRITWRYACGKNIFKDIAKIYFFEFRNFGIFSLKKKQKVNI